MRDFLQNNSEFWLKKCVQKKLPEVFYIKWKELIQETDDEVLGYYNLSAYLLIWAIVFFSLEGTVAAVAMKPWIANLKGAYGKKD